MITVAPRTTDSAAPDRLTPRASSQRTTGRHVGARTAARMIGITMTGVWPTISIPTIATARTISSRQLHWAIRSSQTGTIPTACGDGLRWLRTETSDPLTATIGTITGTAKTTPKSPATAAPTGIATRATAGWTLTRSPMTRGTTTRSTTTLTTTNPTTSTRAWKVDVAGDRDKDDRADREDESDVRNETAEEHQDRKRTGEGQAQDDHQHEGRRGVEAGEDDRPADERSEALEGSLTAACELLAAPAVDRPDERRPAAIAVKKQVEHQERGEDEDRDGARRGRHDARSSPDEPAHRVACHALDRVRRPGRDRLGFELQHEAREAGLDPRDEVRDVRHERHRREGDHGDRRERGDPAAVGRGLRPGPAPLPTRRDDRLDGGDDAGRDDQGRRDHANLEEHPEDPGAQGHDDEAPPAERGEVRQPDRDER